MGARRRRRCLKNAESTGTSSAGKARFGTICAIFGCGKSRKMSRSSTLYNTASQSHWDELSEIPVEKPVVSIRISASFPAKFRMRRRPS